MEAKLDAHGAKLDAHGAKLDAHGVKLDEHTSKLDALAAGQAQIRAELTTGLGAIKRHLGIEGEGRS
ncbi:hypothetical protein [Phytoactinopolyspora halotolerans]|uniref:Uncharacterized protein n=1 Tax=Phytoactinopolyspora halotolerans TaxID=1981512 RepID=A0A6L9SG16_9ACTN|nr:hypothetical protein [Phytoactinopolyspora halotolerans]NEE04049.1 hypothetical protein [Phytoactinopolyspora halotolerans]